VRHHLALLLSILLLFVIGPVVEDLPQGTVIMNALGVLVLAAGLYALRARRSLFTAAIVLSLISIIGTAVVHMTHQEWAAAFAYGCIIVLVVYFAVVILAYVLRGTAVTMDKIFAAVCVYLLIGFAWTFAYALIDALQPGSFVIHAIGNSAQYIVRTREFRYFSFMTLTTVGYGDIVPASTTARTLAALEGVTGQIYLAVLVARLVGLHIVHAYTTAGRKD
jgi:voltage-gated potassium channel